MSNQSHTGTVLSTFTSFSVKSISITHPATSALEAPSSHAATPALITAHFPASPLTPHSSWLAAGTRVPRETTATSLPWPSLRSFTCQTGSVHYPWIGASPLTQYMPVPLTWPAGPTHSCSHQPPWLHTLLTLTLSVIHYVQHSVTIGHFMVCNEYRWERT